jgi:signal transduction histidine kinase
MNEAELGRIMSAVAHDLRTPLTVIAGFARTLERGGRLDEQQARFLGLIFDAAADMDRMIENVSTIGHVVSGRWVPSPAPVTTASLAAAAHEVVRQRPDRPVVLRPGADGDLATDLERAPRAIAQLAEAALRMEPQTPAAFIEPTVDGVRVGPIGPVLMPFVADPGRDVPIEAARIVLAALGAAIVADGNAVVVRFAAT